MNSKNYTKELQKNRMEILLGRKASPVRNLRIETLSTFLNYIESQLVLGQDPPLLWTRERLCTTESEMHLKEDAAMFGWKIEPISEKIGVFHYCIRPLTWLESVLYKLGFKSI